MYEIHELTRDGQILYGHGFTAVLLDDDGAWLGRLDPTGFVPMAVHGEDRPAPEGWMQYVVEEVDDLADMAALFAPHACACGARISAEASACSTCAPGQYESRYQSVA